MFVEGIQGCGKWLVRYLPVRAFMQIRSLSYPHCPLQQRRVLSRCSSKDEKAIPQGLCTPSVKAIPFQGQLGQHLRGVFIKHWEVQIQQLRAGRRQRLGAGFSGFQGLNSWPLTGKAPLTGPLHLPSEMSGSGWFWLLQPCSSPPGFCAWVRVRRLGAVCPDGHTWPCTPADLIRWGTRVCLGNQHPVVP